MLKAAGSTNDIHQHSIIVDSIRCWETIMRCLTQLFRDNWEHFYLVVSWSRRILTVCLFSCTLEIFLLTYIHTYLLTYLLLSEVCKAYTSLTMPLMAYQRPSRWNLLRLLKHIFTGRIPFLNLKYQRQITECIIVWYHETVNSSLIIC